MAGAIIGCIIYFGCAILFFGIGVYAQRCQKPMWFWSGTEVDPATITDVALYNRENVEVVFAVVFRGRGCCHMGCHRRSRVPGFRLYGGDGHFGGYLQQDT